MIRYIKHQGIDKEKWDNCIRHSGIDLEYAHAWYLDVLCPVWDALVMNDYEAAMPLCRKRKYGIDYLFQPFLAQQLGVFSTSGVQSPLVDDFLSAIPDRYRWVDIRLNEMNRPGHEGFVCAERRNFTIGMTKGYEALQQGFSRNCRRNIHKAEMAGLIVRNDLPAEKVLPFLTNNLAKQVKDLDRAFFHTLKEVVQVSIRKGQGELLSVQMPDTTSVIAAGWLLKNDSRLFFQACASSPEGKKHEVMYLLVNHAIRQHASSGRIFDFTGSNLPGVAYFNASFGARPSSYPAVYRNKLPFPLKVLKKKPVWVRAASQP